MLNLLLQLLIIVGAAHYYTSNNYYLLGAAQLIVGVTLEFIFILISGRSPLILTSKLISWAEGPRLTTSRPAGPR